MSTLTLVCLLLGIFLVLALLLLAYWDANGRSRIAREESEASRRRLDAHRHYLKELEKHGLQNWKGRDDG